MEPLSLWQTTRCASRITPERAVAIFRDESNSIERPYKQDEHKRSTDQDCHSHCRRYLEDLHADPDGYFDAITDEFIPGKRPVQLRFLRVCRQVWHECNPIFWSTNTFSFDDAATFAKFMEYRTSTQKASIRSLRLNMELLFPEDYGDWNRALPAVLATSLRGLRHVAIELQSTMTQRSPPKDSWRVDMDISALENNFLRLSVLPLSEATVIILPSEGPPSETAWQKSDYIRWAKKLERYLLNPDGAAHAAFEREYLRELMRIERLKTEMDKSDMYRCRHGSQAVCDKFHEKWEADRKTRALSEGKKFNKGTPCLSQHKDEQGRWVTSRHYTGRKTYEEIRKMEDDLSARRRSREQGLAELSKG